VNLFVTEFRRQPGVNVTMFYRKERVHHEAAPNVAGGFLPSAPGSM